MNGSPDARPREARGTTPRAAAPPVPPAARQAVPDHAPVRDGHLRQWVLEFPAGMELLNANQRHSWRRKARVTAELRRTGGWLARIRKVPRLERARVDARYEPPDKRKRDPSNWFPSYKAAIDGITDAGVLADDDSEHLDGPHMDIGPVHAKGRIVLTVTELAGER